MIRSVLLLAALCLADRAVAEPLLASDWEQRLRSYQHGVVALYERSVATGHVQFSDLTQTVYGPKRPVVAGAGRDISPFFDVDCAADEHVVVDTMACDNGLHGYVWRRQGTVVIGTPLSRDGYTPIRIATALAHEITHTAQTRPGRYPAWLAVWSKELAEREPGNAIVYLLRPDEIEVRLAEFRRMIAVAGPNVPVTPQLLTRWFAALGVPGIKQTGSGPEIGDYARGQLLLAFPDFAELLTVAKVSAGDAAAESRRHELLDLWCAIALQVY